MNRSPSTVVTALTRPLRDTLLIVGITTALLVLAEMGLRVWFPKEITVLDEDDPWLTSHPDFIYTLRPLVTYDLTHDPGNGGHTTRLDTLDLFTESSPDTLYFRGRDNHWNAKGQHLAASATTRYIVDHCLNHATDRDTLGR